MTDLQIHELSGTATEFGTLEYIAVDNSTDDSRKMLASVLQALIRNNLENDELAILDGATLSTAELNILDGCTATFTELNYLAGLTPGASSASGAVVLDENQDGTIGRDLAITRNLAVTGTSTLGGTVSTNAIDMSGNLDINGNDLILDADGDSKLYEKADDIISMNLGGVEEYRWNASNFGCATAGDNNLGGALGVESASAPNAWNHLNIIGNIYMGESTAPASATIDGSCVLYMDTATGDVMLKIRHGGSSVIATLADFSEL